jgi:hypothetical protein
LALIQPIVLEILTASFETEIAVLRKYLVHTATPRTCLASNTLSLLLRVPISAGVGEAVDLPEWLTAIPALNFHDDGQYNKGMKRSV